MSRGLSRYQKAILETLKQEGSLDIWDVNEVVWETQHRNDEHHDFFRALIQSYKGSEVKTIRNYSSLYRMMESLVKRGLVGKVLHIRPTVWVELKNGTPSLEAIKSREKLLLRITDGLTVKIGNKIKVFKISV